MIFPIWMVPAIIHTHVGTQYVKRAGALYTTRVPLGSIDSPFCIVLATLNKQALCPVWNVCPVAWSKTQGCPRLTTFARTHTHIHTSTQHTHTHNTNTYAHTQHKHICTHTTQTHMHTHNTDIYAHTQHKHICTHTTQTVLLLQKTISPFLDAWLNK